MLNELWKDVKKKKEEKKWENKSIIIIIFLIDSFMLIIKYNTNTSLYWNVCFIRAYREQFCFFNFLHLNFFAFSIRFFLMSTPVHFCRNIFLVHFPVFLKYIYMYIFSAFVFYFLCSFRSKVTERIFRRNNISDFGLFFSVFRLRFSYVACNVVR